MAESLHHVPMTREELAAVLRDILARVENGDSFEGSIEYLMDYTIDADQPADFMVRGSYRTGNTMGQGGVRLVGEFRDGSMGR